MGIAAVTLVRDGARNVSVSVENDDKTIAIIAGDAKLNYRAHLRTFPDFIYHSSSQARVSIRKIRKMKPAMIMPGHDSPFNGKGYVGHDELSLILRRDRGKFDNHLRDGHRRQVCDIHLDRNPD
jgi:hypothetical protein